MDKIIYREGMELVLLVKDTFGFDGFQVFVDDTAAAPPQDDQLLHRYPIPRPGGEQTVSVVFGGNDGGASAVFDVAAQPPKRLDAKKGLTHKYEIEAG